MIKHILYPTDGSEAAKIALVHLEKLAQVYQAQITLLHCYEFTMGHVLSRYDTDSGYIQEIEGRFRFNCLKNPFSPRNPPASGFESLVVP